MGSIKELAHNAAMQIYGDIGISKFSIERVEEIIVEKLTEQKAIDIDKALDAHCEYCDHTCPKGMECYIRENIRKAMEE